jgi:predicted DNA-binding mobile mystery protein A
LSVSRAQIAQAEGNELSGAVTLKTLQKMAEGMNCRVVYAFVPEASAQATVENRAKEKAEQLVSRADIHMALESQSLDKASRNYEVERLTRELLDKMPSDLWDDV